MYQQLADDGHDDEDEKIPDLLTSSASSASAFMCYGLACHRRHRPKPKSRSHHLTDTALPNTVKKLPQDF